MTKRPSKVTPEFARGYSAGFTAAATAPENLDADRLADAMLRHAEQVTKTDILHARCSFDCAPAIAAEYDHRTSDDADAG